MFDGIYRMWHGYKFPEVRISRCDYAEEILKSSKHIEKSPTYLLLEPWLGNGGWKCTHAFDNPLTHSFCICFRFNLFDR